MLSILIIHQMELEETCIFRNIYIVINNLTIRTANGGFYPPQPIAKYKQSYVSQLRYYDRPKTPS
jgi:hypothetical protein